MKNSFSKIVFGCLGLCVGLALCYVKLVVPQREVELAALTAQQSSEAQIVIVIARDGSLRLADRNVDLKDLATILKKLGAHGQSIRIHADKGAPWSRVVDVMDACKAAGVGKAILMATATTK